MMRLLRELDRADAGVSPGAVRARSVARRLLAAASVTLLVAAFLFLLAHKLWGVTLTGDGFRLSGPLGRLPEVATGVGTYTFLQHQPGDPDRPVAYDPCRPIEYELNDTLAPPGAAPLVRDAVDGISRATGLQFEYVGTTDRVPDPDARPIGDSREPVLIAWTTPQVVPELENRTAGIGGSRPQRHEFSGDLHYVTGMVALDSPAMHEVLAGPNGPALARAIVLHELGHLVGLGHVKDSNELMHDDNAGRLDLGPGDREGLALLGSGACYR